MSSAELREKAAVFLAAIGSDSVDDEGKGDALIASALYECTAALIDALAERLPSERERAELAALQALVGRANEVDSTDDVIDASKTIADALLNAREARDE